MGDLKCPKCKSHFDISWWADSPDDVTNEFYCVNCGYQIENKKSSEEKEIKGLSEKMVELIENGFCFKTRDDKEGKRFSYWIFENQEVIDFIGYDPISIDSSIIIDKAIKEAIKKNPKLEKQILERE